MQFIKSFVESSLGKSQLVLSLVKAMTDFASDISDLKVAFVNLKKAVEMQQVLIKDLYERQDIIAESTFLKEPSKATNSLFETKQKTPKSN